MTIKSKNKSIIDSKAMGADFCWSFGDGDAEACKLPRQDVRALFAEHGFDPMAIEDLDMSEALKRATCVHRGKDIIIKELKSPNKDTPRAFGIYVVRGVQGESGDNIECGARVRVRSATEAICLPPEGRQEIKECMDVGVDMVRLAHELCANVVNRDVSQAILSVGARLGWISRRRNKGGVYYLHLVEAERFAALLKGIQAMTATRHRDEQFIPHITEQYDRPLTVDSWSGAAKDHYEAQVGQLVKDLDRVFVDGKMRESTMVDRADECDRILKEANKYAIFMKAALPDLETRLKKIRAAFTKAIKDGSDSIEKDIKDIEKLIGTHEPKKAKEVKVAEPVKEEKPKKQRKAKLEDVDFDLNFAK
jgi:hypothetical protein